MPNGGAAASTVAALIRPAAAADLPVVASIYAHHVRHGLGSFEEEPPNVDELGRRYAEITDRGLPWVVAEHEGTVAGYAYAGPYRLRPAYRFTLEDSVYVAPGRGGLGLGRALLGRLIQLTESAGYRQLIAVIGDSGNAPSIQLHRALGFRQSGLLTAIGFKQGRWVDVVLMQRALGSGAATLPIRSARP
jgi:phosphinothricin acetyltransferase